MLDNMRQKRDPKCAHRKPKPKTSRLDALPAELRSTIYKLVIHAAITTNVSSLRTRAQIAAARRRPAILQVCSQTRREAAHMYIYLLKEQVEDADAEVGRAFEAKMDVLMAVDYDAKLLWRMDDRHDEALKQWRHLRTKLERERRPSPVRFVRGRKDREQSKSLGRRHPYVWNYILPL